MVCPATTPHEAFAELVPLAPKKQRKKPRAMPCYCKLCKGWGEPVSLTSEHMSFRGGRGVVMLGRGHKHKDMQYFPRKASQPFPVHLHHPAREEQIKGMCQKETKLVTRSSSVCLLF